MGNYLLIRKATPLTLLLKNQEWLAWVLNFSVVNKHGMKSIYWFCFSHVFSFFLIYFFLFFFSATPETYGGSQAKGLIRSNRSYSCWPTPQPQQRQILAMSVTYTTAHSNARSLTHWARLGIEPSSSWMLVRPGIKPSTPWFSVGFISATPQGELLTCILRALAATSFH